MALGVTATRAQFLFVLLAYACLTWAFVAKDFSVAYVAQNANSQLPIFAMRCDSLRRCCARRSSSSIFPPERCSGSAAP